MEQGKRHRWLRPPSPAMIVAVIALIVAMSGTSYAAVTLAANSVGTKQLKKNAVTGAKVKNGSLTGADLKAATLTANKIGPLPGARVHQEAALPVTSTTAYSTKLTFDTVDFNVGDVYKASQPDRLTAPRAGTYLIIGSALWQTNANGARKISIVRNSTPIAANELAGSDDMDGVFQQVQTVYQLDAGDAIHLYAVQNSGVSLNASYYSPKASLSMNWIAP